MILFLNILGILSILVIVCLVIVLIISYCENRTLHVTEYFVQSKKLPISFDGFRIAHLSDLHNAEFGEDNMKLYETIREQKPDVILITGDMIIGKPEQDVIKSAQFINSLCDIAPVFFSMGNHELRVSLYIDTYGDMWEEFLETISSDVHLLFDERYTITKQKDTLNLYGLSLNTKLYKRLIRTPMPNDYIESLFGNCNKKEYHIFMAHNPDYFKDYVEWGADLTFSGHVHGGMVRLPWLGGVLSPMIHFFPKYDKGLFQEKDAYMVLSGGLGNHTFKFRVNNLPEVVMVTLHTDKVSDY